MIALGSVCALLGVLLGAALMERWWWFLGDTFPRPLHPLPRPWRAAVRTWRYLAPGTVWRDVRRCWTTGRWTA